MKRLAIMGLAVLLLAGTAATVWADHGAAQKAYQAGDYQTAMRIWRPLAEQGNAQAQVMLGLLYDQGQGVISDFSKAVYWWRQAAEQGDPLAQDFLGVMYLNGMGVPPDQKQARVWRRKAYEQWLPRAQRGDGEAIYRLYNMYVDTPPDDYPRHLRGHPNDIGMNLPEVWKLVTDFWRKRAVAGDARSQLRLAEALKLSGAPGGRAEAARWLHKAAEQGLAEAQYRLGLDYYGHVYFMPKDYQQAVLWLGKAAEQGHARARFMLAEIITEGLRRVRDTKTAVRWYRLAAEQGHASAQRRMGDMLRRGFYLPKDLPKARAWYLKAATQDYEARLHLARMYEQGRGGPQDLKRAAFWYGKAAEQHWYHEKAKYQMGLLYAEGRGVPRDLVRAHMWFYLATRNPGGDDDAVRFMKALEAKMSPAQIAEAKRLARTWHPR